MSDNHEAGEGTGRSGRSEGGQVGECLPGPADDFLGTRQVARFDVMAAPRAEFDAASERNRKDPNWRRHMLGTCRWGCHACGKLFGGLTGFDAHRTGAYTSEHPHYGRHCLSDDELRAKGYTLSDSVWRMPIGEADKAKLSQLRKQT